MNTKGLTRFYDSLTPWERLPMIVAASARDDAVERERLVHSAPTHAFRVPDYRGLAEGLDDLVKLHLLEQLDLAVLYWRTTAWMDEETRCRKHRRDGRWEERSWQRVRLLAYRLVARADGWQSFYAQLPLDPDVLLRVLPGYEAVRQMEELARLVAFSAEEADAYLREVAQRDQSLASKMPRSEGGYRIETAADVASSMWEFLRARGDCWR
jgi:hypothetical protein